MHMELYEDPEETEELGTLPMIGILRSIIMTMPLNKMRKNQETGTEIKIQELGSTIDANPVNVTEAGNPTLEQSKSSRLILQARVTHPMSRSGNPLVISYQGHGNKKCAP